MSLDDSVERASRAAAGRFTRRSFLGRAGKAAVLVAGGPALATLLADPAEARVCGQSGVAPKCPTFDCDATWGWCWYASGCCSDGLLKKICDCCAPNTPHPVGYCPSGLRVKCIVESCGADPRVQVVPVLRLPSDGAFQLLAVLRFLRFAGTGATTAVFATAGSAEAASVAFPVAARLGAPLYLVGNEVDQRTLDELGALGVRRVVAVGAAWFPPAVAQALADRGIASETVGTSLDPAVLSLEVARWFGRSPSQVAIGRSDSAGTTTLALAVAANLATRLRAPLLIGMPAALIAAEQAGDPRPRSLLVGVEALGHTAAFGGLAVAAWRTDNDVVGSALQANRIDPPVDRNLPIAVPIESAGAAWAAAHGGQPLLLHPPGSLLGVREWVGEHRSSMAGIGLAGTAGRLGDPQVYELQSLANRFATDKLVGVAGQGLPVISQPVAERPLGMAREGLAPVPVRVRQGRRWAVVWQWPS